MKIASLADVKARLSAYVDECRSDGPIVITRNGKPAAVLLVPESNDDLERLILAHSPRLKALLDRSRRSLDEGRGLSEQSFWKAVQARSKKPAATSARGRPTRRNKQSPG